MISSIVGAADCWKPICQGLGWPRPAYAMPPAARTPAKTRAAAADRIIRMSTSIGVFAPSTRPSPPCNPKSVPRALRSRLARRRLPAKLRALGDSATNGALRLLKPQFSPTRNAPLKLQAYGGVDPGKAGFAAVFRLVERLLPALCPGKSTCTHSDLTYR